MLNRFKPKRKQPTTPAGPQVPDDMMLVKKEDYEKVVNRLDALEKGTIGEPKIIERHITAPAQPTPTPSGPTVTDQVADIDKKLAQISNDIDKAIKDEQPIGELLMKQNSLSSQRTSLLLDNTVQQVQQMGLEYMSTITDNLPQDFPYLAVKEVKDTYDEYVKAMPPEQRANPMARQIAYQNAVGANTKAVIDHEKVGWESSMVDEEGRLIGQIPGLKVPTAPEPTGSKVKPDDLGEGAQDALDYVGRSTEEFAKKLGYESWDDYIEQTTIEEGTA